MSKKKGRRTAKQAPRTRTRRQYEWVVIPSVTKIQATATAPPSTNALEGDERVFTLFPKLPPELRVKIWKCTELDSRIILIVPELRKVLQTPATTSRSKRRSQKHVVGERTVITRGQITMEAALERHQAAVEMKNSTNKISSIPIALRVCVESRYTALKAYDLLFTNPSAVDNFRVNYTRDILVFLHPEAMIYFLGLEDQDEMDGNPDRLASKLLGKRTSAEMKLRNLVVGHCMNSENSDLYFPMLSRFEKLNRITVDCGWRDLYNKLELPFSRATLWKQIKVNAWEQKVQFSKPTIRFFSHLELHDEYLD